MMTFEKIFRTREYIRKTYKHRKDEKISGYTIYNEDIFFLEDGMMDYLRYLNHDYYDADDSQLSRELDSVMLTEHNLASSVFRLKYFGSHVFRFSPQLVTMLANTDVGDVLYEDVFFPQHHFYIDFSELPTDIFSMLDRDVIGGSSQFAKNFCIRGVAVDKELADEWESGEGMEDGNYDGITLNIFCENIDTLSVESKKTTDYFVINYVLSPETGDFQTWASVSGKKIDELELFCGSAVYPKDTDDNISYYEGKKSALLPVAKSVFNFVVNALLFMKYCEYEKRVTSDLQIARDLLEKKARAKKKSEVNKIDQDLSRISYTKINYFKISSDVNSRTGDEIGSGEEGTKSSHWRRGHWRRQRFGKGFKDVMIVWIKPALVNAGQGSLSEKGKIYNV